MENHKRSLSVGQMCNEISQISDVQENTNNEYTQKGNNTKLGSKGKSNKKRAFSATEEPKKSVSRPVVGLFSCKENLKKFSIPLSI